MPKLTCIDDEPIEKESFSSMADFFSVDGLSK